MGKGKTDGTSRERQASQETSAAGLARRLQHTQKTGVDHVRYFLIHRWKNASRVRRPILTWLLAAIVLIAAGAWQIQHQQALYSHQGPTEGGTYIEGTVGSVSTLNPIFAANVAEKSLTNLLFSGLLRVDSQGDIIGDMAGSWSVGEDGRVYTITLRENLQWSDGTPITTEDVAFTIDAIQSTETRSPLASAWQGVGVETVDERTVRFTLEAPYAPFPRSLTVGILPKHVLSNTPLTQLRSAIFNNQPNVTSGPFRYRGTVGSPEGQIRTDVYLARNNDYHLGAVKVDRFTMRVYEDEESLVNAMRNREIMAANDVPTNSTAYFKSQNDMELNRMPLFSGVFAFFNMQQSPLNDRDVRRALALGTDLEGVTNSVGNVSPMQGPLLPEQLGFKESLDQPTGNPERANELLEKAGWKLNDDGIRYKKEKKDKQGTPLQLQIVTLSTGEFGTVAQTLQTQWEQLGVDVEVELVDPSEFQQNTLAQHAYDVLVYQLALGHDSDSYSFWHSSQAQSGRLNFSLYESDAVDRALESGRSVTNPQLRDIKYSDFIKQWIDDAPAVALYRPNLYYVQLEDTRSVEPGPIGNAQERFANIRYWTAETGWLYETR